VSGPEEGCCVQSSDVGGSLLPCRGQEAPQRALAHSVRAHGVVVNRALKRWRVRSMASAAPSPTVICRVERPAIQTLQSPLALQERQLPQLPGWRRESPARARLHRIRLPSTANPFSCRRLSPLCGTTTPPRRLSLRHCARTPILAAFPASTVVDRSPETSPPAPDPASVPLC
jgi:hypothetical protein